MAESLLSGGDPAATPNPDPNPAGGDHWSATLPDDLKPWAAGMGLDKLPERDALAKVLPMYRGAEQKLGVPAEQVLRLPGEKATADEIKAFRTKLGVPETPDAYKLDEALKDDPLAGKFRAKAHELGVPAAQFEQLVSWFTGESTALREAQEAQFDQQAEAEITELKGAWGNDFDKNIDLAKRVARTMGINEQEARHIERVLGLKRTAEVFSKFGGALGEHRFAGGQNGAQSFGMSAEAAKQRIGDLRKDGEWMAKYTQGDADKKAEWTRLHQIAFPEQQAA